MATRFYFEFITPLVGDVNGLAWFGPGGTSGVDVAWNDKSIFANCLSLTPKVQLSQTTNLNDASINASATGTRNVYNKDFVSSPLAVGGKISGTFSMVIRCSQTATTNAASLAVVVKVCSGDGSAVRGTLYSVFGIDTAFPLTASAATRIVNAQAITPVVALPGDRIHIEYGYHTTASTTTSNIVMRNGASTSVDFALTSGLTTDLNPWCEFSQDLFGTLDTNHQFFKVGDGMSTGEKIR